MKKIALVALLILAILTTVGCKALSNKVTASEGQKMKDAGNDALKYMKDKYGEDFTPITYGMSDYLSDTDVVECYPSWMNPEYEHVSVFIHNDEGGRLGDNYFEFIKREELETSVKNIIEPDFGDQIKVYQSCLNEELSSELTADSSIEDLYSSMKDYCIWADVFISSNTTMTEEEFSKKMSSVKDRFCQTGKSFVIHLYTVDDSTYESVSREDRSEVMDAYQQNWKPDGIIVKNAEDIMVSRGFLVVSREE